MNRAIDDLVHEHGAIFEAVRILEGMAGRLGGGLAVDEGDVSDLLGFLKLFVDRCHHGKEEAVLFPALVRSGVPADEGVVGVLLAEHLRGRELVGAMESSSFPKFDRPRFAAAARGLAEPLEHHIRNENENLFPMAERLLTPHQLDEVTAGFAIHEASVVGEGRHEELYRLLGTLRERYAAG
jgi:hemerythrin-like domain-containing protein